MSKKRSSEDVVEIVGAHDVDAAKRKKKKTKEDRKKSPKVEQPSDSKSVGTDDVDVAKPKKKKTKEDLKKSPKVEHGDAAGLFDSKSVSAMERKKKRKALDKKRHHAGSENQESNSKQMNVEEIPEAPLVPVKSTDLPEFHISVFKDLASADDSVREAAVESLVKELQEVQRAYDRLENKELVEGGPKLESEKDDGLNNCAPSLRYAVRRLIRGVSSSRECARQGFALGLTVLVDTIPSVRVDSLLKITLEILEVSSSMKGQEVRDCLLGRLFVYGALSRMGRLVSELEADKNTPLVKEFTSALISLSTKKRYLQEPAVCVLLELVEKLSSEGVLTHVIGAPGVQEWFEGAAENGNPDALLLALKVREKTSGGNPSFGKLLPNPFSPGNFFSSDHLSSLAKIMKESTFCQPRVHGVWAVITNMLLPDVILQEEDVEAASNSLKKHKKGRKSSPSKDETLKNLQCFCEVVIEGSLLLSSHDRKNLALDVILLLLPRLPASFIPTVLSYKVVQCLIDVLSTKDSWLYKVAQNFLKELSDWARSDDVRKVAVAVALQKNTNGKFDITTQTRTIKNLVADFQTESGCMLFIQSLTNMFVDEGPSSEEPSDQSQTTDDNSEIGSLEGKDSIATAGSSDSLKSWVIESIPNVVKSSKLDSEVKCRVQKEALKFLAVQGLFTSSLGSEVTSFELEEKFRWPKAATSSALCRMCIEQVQSLLAAAQKGEGLHISSSTTEQSDLGSYFIRFLSTLRNIPSVSLFRSLSDQDESEFKKLQEMEIRLFREEKSSTSGPDSRKLRALRHLLIQLLLQALLRPGEFTEAASELIICCEKSFSRTDEPAGDDEMNSDDAPELIDVLVDTLLSLLPQSSAPMRSAIEQVFKGFCSEVTEDGLRQMLRVIKKALKPPRHQEAGSEDDDDEDVLEIEEEEDEELREAETGDTAESDGLTDDSEAVNGHEENSGDDSEGSDESDEDMDDEAMFRMDTYLAKIFKDRKNQGAGGESAHSQLVLFKLRVLSLLEIYLHENPGKAQVLTVYSNLARAFVTTEGSEQLSQRIWGILQKKIFKAKDYPKGESVQLSALEPLLQRNLRWASKPFKRKSANNPPSKQSASWNRHKMITSLAQNSTHWLLKIIDARRFSEHELARVYDILQGVIVGYFDSKQSQIKVEFLKEIIKRRPWIGRSLFGFIIEKCSNAKSDFRSVEALGLVGEILKQLFPSSNNGTEEASINLLEAKLHQLSRLVERFVTNMPKKQVRRAEVRRFCGKLFQILSSVDRFHAFVELLSEDARAACESQLGKQFAILSAKDE